MNETMNKPCCAICWWQRKEGVSGHCSNLQCECHDITHPSLWSVPEAARAAYTCFHKFEPADPLDTISIRLYCSKCGTTVEGNKIMPPVALVKPQDPESWAKGFDKICTQDGYKTTLEILVAVKSFIHSLLQSERQKLVEKLEGMKVLMMPNRPGENVKRILRNEVIDEIINLLNE